MVILNKNFIFNLEKVDSYFFSRFFFVRKLAKNYS